MSISFSPDGVCTIRGAEPELEQCAATMEQISSGTRNCSSGAARFNALYKYVIDVPFGSRILRKIQGIHLKRA